MTWRFIIWSMPCADCLPHQWSKHRVIRLEMLATFALFRVAACIKTLNFHAGGSGEIPLRTPIRFVIGGPEFTSDTIRK